MRYAFFAAAVLALMPLGAAQATQIVNNDEAASYTLTVMAPAGESTIDVASGVVLEDACPQGCTLILGDQEVAAKAEDTVTIENGKLGLDE